MAAMRLALALLLCAVGSSAHPVESVIGLLKGLIAKTTNEGKQEEMTYLKFDRWCRNSKKSLDTAIAESKEDMDVLSSKIQSEKEESALLTEQIEALDEELMKLATADEKAEAERDSAAKVYEQAETDFTDTIAAIDTAMEAVKTAQSDTAAMVQTKGKVQKILDFANAVLTEKQRSIISAYLQEPPERPELKAEGDYEGHIKTYKFKSGSVIEMLKDLKLKFEDEAQAAKSAEQNAIDAYTLAKEARTDLTNRATDSKTEKESALSDSQDALNEAEGNYNSTRDELAADEETLSQTTKACSVKASEWAERSATRKGELEAMETAIKILAKVTGVRSEAPENPVPPASPVEAGGGGGGGDFLQFGASDPKARAVELLRRSARETHSRALERLAQEIATSAAGPFDSVNNEIQKMIFHLMDEQKDEDKHKQWCDLELNKTDISIADKEDRMEELKAKLDDAKATIQTLSEDVEKANEAATEIASHVEEATTIRAEGKAENKEALKDAQEAQSAISKAIAVLEAFYKDSGAVPKEDWEFVQKQVDLPEQPETWDSSYTGVSDPAEQPAGIISVLKETSADFAQMEAQTKSQEESDQKTYEEDMKACAIEKARRLKEADVKAQEKRRLVDKVAVMTKSRKHVANEKEATEQYLADLQHACVDGDSTYEDRKEARNKEIEALKEAQVILTKAFENLTKNGGEPTEAPEESLAQRGLRVAKRHYK